MKAIISTLCLVSMIFLMGCPAKSDKADESVDLPAVNSLPADQIDADNAEKQADSLLKDLDNL